jgi:DTW domain-containing protein YfiP
LQHKDEVRHPKGSAIIADLYLQRCTRYVGEDFSDHQPLNQLLQNHPHKVCLVFPSAQAVPLSLFRKQYADAENALAEYTFIFIDASWRKARKIWHLSTNLQPLTTIRLDKLDPSSYRIRKEPGSGLVSTLESIVALLSSLEQQPAKYQPLLAVFDEMIDRQIRSMGEDVYQKNYTP